MSDQLPSKSVVSVSEMATMCRISRSRFYQLIKKGIFPKPKYDPETGRPFYDSVAQEVCISVRATNCGVNNQPIMFYSSRRPTETQPNRVKTPKRKPKPKSQYADLIDNLNSLGLSATSDQVEAAIKTLYPAGMQNLESCEITRGIFLHLKRKDSSK